MTYLCMLSATVKTGCNPKEEFDCKNDGQNCIPLDDVCNSRNDCGAFEDEQDDLCNATAANPCDKNNGGCGNLCVKPKYNKFYCTCRAGYKLNADNQTCDDIDECHQPGMCSQICTNNKGSFKCSCVEGYSRDPRNPHFCKASSHEPTLMFANRHDLREFNLHGRDYINLVGGLRSAVAIDFHYSQQRLYWSDVAFEKILSTPLVNPHHNLSEKADTVVSEDISTPDGIAVDWIHNNLYWTDTGKDRIEVISLGPKKNRRILFSEQLEEPRALVLDPRTDQG